MKRYKFKPRLGIPGEASWVDIIFVAFPGNVTKNLQKKVPEWGPDKKVPESAGLVGGSGPSFGPDLIFKSGQEHNIWPEMDPESMVRPENRSP